MSTPDNQAIDNQRLRDAVESDRHAVGGASRNPIVIQLIKSIARAERRRLVPRRHSRAGQDCDVAANHITSELLARGLRAETVTGCLVAPGKADWLMHLWTEADGLLIDVTLDQISGLFPKVVVDPVAKCRDHPRLGLLYSPFNEFHACMLGTDDLAVGKATLLRTYRRWRDYLAETVLATMAPQGCAEERDLVPALYKVLNVGRLLALRGHPDHSAESTAFTPRRLVPATGRLKSRKRAQLNKGLSLEFQRLLKQLDLK